MKYKRLAVFVENKKGEFYQVLLNKSEMDMVAISISALHKNKINIAKEKFSSIYFEDKINNK
jgi:hypothetical protein